MHFFRLRLVAGLLLGIVLISVASTYFDVLAHRHTMRTDLARRTEWFGAGLQPQIEQQLQTGKNVDWAELLRRLRPRADEPSLAAVDPKGKLLALVGNAPAPDNLPDQLISQSLTAGKEMGSFVRIPEAQSGPSQSGSSKDAGVDPGPGNGQSTGGGIGTGASAAGASTAETSAQLWYEDVLPLRQGGQVVGALLMMVNAGNIHREEIGVWQRSFLRIVALVLVVVGVTFLMLRWFLQKPVTRAAAWLRRVRHGEADAEETGHEFGYLTPLAQEVSSLAEKLTQARAAAETEARLRDQAENLWTADRLAVHARDQVGSGQLFAVSNREPYVHMRRKGKRECVVPPSGLVTALEPILQACDGTWIAHGSGNDDMAFVDSHDRERVPPADKRYTLRRVWLSPEEEMGYYEGFSNEGLWPLCHIAHTRPTFRAGDWKQYQRVNERFFEVLLEEIAETQHPVIFLQDYHFALLPRLIKHARPDARVAIFWHIPWPNPEAFSICPWQAELLDGLLGADVIGFHLQSHCNNFLDTVDRALEAKTDWEHFSIQRNGHVSLVRNYPIGVAWGENNAPRSEVRQAAGENGKTQVNQFAEVPLRKELRLVSAGDGSDVSCEALRRGLGIEGKMLLGVDRMDYTKGIVERLLAIEHLLQEYPWYLEEFTFVQIASPSRTGIPRYRELRIQVEETVLRINDAFQTARWKPVILIERQLSHEELDPYYRAADLCLVTSLHDGMNLVAKEYVAARNDCDGVLVLSRFAGAAQELRDALLVNPYDVARVSEAIVTGLTMGREERSMRMKRMRRQVKEHNVYRWASNILTDLCAKRIEDDMLAVALNRSHRRRA